MNYNVINQALLDVGKLRRGYTKFKLETSNKTNNVDTEEGTQGESDEIIEVYNLGVDNLYLKLTFCTDSYGDNESLCSVQIVKPVTKTVINFEPIV